MRITHKMFFRFRASALDWAVAREVGEKSRKTICTYTDIAKGIINLKDIMTAKDFDVFMGLKTLKQPEHLGICVVQLLCEEKSRITNSTSSN